MISTVATSTISTITTAVFAGFVALIGILVLLVLLIKKELASAAVDTRFKTLTMVFNIGIVPLLITFGVVVISRVVEILHLTLIENKRPGLNKPALYVNCSFGYVYRTGQRYTTKYWFDHAQAC
jgi:hypothetical protein